MATVIMPKMGDAMEEGTLLKWLKTTGEEISDGDPLAEIETDKVTLEINAEESGYLTNQLVEEGAVVPIGTPIATIGTQDEVGAESAPAAAPAEAEAEAEAPAAEAEAPAAEPEPTDTPKEEPVAAQAAPSQAPAAAQSSTETVSRAPDERVRASPLVKRLAAEHGIDLTVVAGTGPGGRIIKNDINDFVTGAKPIPVAANGAAAQPQERPAETTTATPSPAGKGEVVELSKIRRTTGQRMAESKRDIPHFYVTSAADLTDALAFRKQINAALEADGVKVSVNDMIVKAAALALKDHMEVNTSYEGDTLYQHDSIDINFAIALEGGLIAPFVPAADGKSLGAIARLTKDLTNRARSGGLTPAEYQGGTFTISNLGMYDVTEFIGVINPPQAAILAVGSATETPVVRDGKIAIGNIMNLTVSADHRALDGATVAEFLQSIKKYLEQPMLLAVS